MKEITKSLPVSKRIVWEAYQLVRANKGSAGIDKESIEDFDADLSKNLYKLWNRMASGCYMPPPVRTVFIPKPQGGKRPLGIPTVSDRIAQTVVKQYAEPFLEELFHCCSFGYRPKRNAHQAIGLCYNNCRKYAWAIDLDIKGFFDNINHEYLMKMLQRHIRDKWVLLYTQRWLTAGVEQEDGSIQARATGTPQGGVLSPLLANLYLHYVFDIWISQQYPQCRFERYADDIVIHCNTKAEAEEVLKSTDARMRLCKLELNIMKTRIVYCRQEGRNERAEHESFTFLGYTFQPRSTRDWQNNRNHVVFRPAISQTAKAKVRKEVKAVLQRRWTNMELSEYAKMLNPKLRGWIYYYGKFGKWVTLSLMQYVNVRILRWLEHKYKLWSKKKALDGIKVIIHQIPDLFYHWTIGVNKIG